jgi:pimeloyl-ACP methyl ester carboxylesterase
MGLRFGPEYPDITYVRHGYAESNVDLGEVKMNYAVAGQEGSPALLLVPGQTESWWGYEAAMRRLEADFRTYAVDLRGQGRSTRTPGRYTADNIGNDLVRFIQLVIGRPTIVSGCSSGGVLTAWLCAYAPPGLVRGGFCEDPPLFACELNPSCGHSFRQGAAPIFGIYEKYIGDQWRIGDWAGLRAAVPRELPVWAHSIPIWREEEPPQQIREYDPEWARAFREGTWGASLDHARMLAHVKAPVMLSHHSRSFDPVSGEQHGALSDIQARRVRELIEATGQRCDYRSFPSMGHVMHLQDPELFASVLTKWAATLG